MSVQKIKAKGMVRSSTKRLHDNARLLTSKMMKGVAGSWSRVLEAQWTEYSVSHVNFWGRKDCGLRSCGSDT
jgi:hypothetical protein